MPPGPALAVALAEVDPAGVPNGAIVDLMVAQSRQLAHDQARLWAVINEVLHRRPFTPVEQVHRSEFPELFAADEVRAAVTWTRRAAEGETDLAFVLAEHLPLVLCAVSEGAIDRGRAVVFARHLADLTVEQATAICRALLPVAPRLTTGQLSTRRVDCSPRASPAAAPSTSTATDPAAAPSNCRSPTPTCTASPATPPRAGRGPG